MYVAKIGEMYFSDTGNGKYTGYLVTPIPEKAWIFGEPDSDIKFTDDLKKYGFKFYKLNEVEIEK